MKENKIDVTVIISTYNSDINKIKRTLCSVTCQKNISFEVIVTDDGSHINNTKQIEELINMYNISRAQIIRNESNIGTVRNFYGAIEHAQGEYVYGISPGDMLYDENTLKKFYDFSNSNNVKCVFGNVVCYAMNGDNLQLLERVNRPAKPQIFDAKKSQLVGKLAVLQGHKICGASFFRETESALENIGNILNFAKYVEDTTSTMSYVLNGEKVVYCPEKIAWYECGTGISTSGENEWDKIIKSEIDITRDNLFEKYSNDKVIKYIKVKRENKNKMLCTIKSVLRYPILGFYDMMIKTKKEVYSDNQQSDLDKLKIFWNI